MVTPKPYFLSGFNEWSQTGLFNDEITRACASVLIIDREIPVYIIVVFPLCKVTPISRQFSGRDGDKAEMNPATEALIMLSKFWLFFPSAVSTRKKQKAEKNMILVFYVLNHSAIGSTAELIQHEMDHDQFSSHFILWIWSLHLESRKRCLEGFLKLVFILHLRLTASKGVSNAIDSLIL